MQLKSTVLEVFYSNNSISKQCIRKTQTNTYTHAYNPNPNIQIRFFFYKMKT